jgi:hypothetical protein
MIVKQYFLYLNYKKKLTGSKSAIVWSAAMMTPQTALKKVNLPACRLLISWPPLPSPSG